jgi:hypothetical protein
VPELLVAALLPVVLYCIGRAVTRRSHGGGADGHHRDLDVWHVLMGVAMIAMLLGRMPPRATVPVFVISVVAVGWGVRAIGRTTSATAYARLAVGGAAMAVMVPLAPAQAATGGAGAGDGMAAMGHDLWLPLGLALLVVLAATVATAVWAMRRPGGVVRRLDACCDVVMAAAMAGMLIQVL